MWLTLRSLCDMDHGMGKKNQYICKVGSFLGADVMLYVDNFSLVRNTFRNLYL